MPRVALDLPAPDFQLADFKGETFQLAALKGVSNVLLVFNRGFM
jgi:peroxiredoxin